MPRKNTAESAIRFLKNKNTQRMDKELLAILLKEYLHSLSVICREKSWHKTGVHLYVASEELEKMLDSGNLIQEGL